MSANIPRKAVKSSNIKSVGYDKASKAMVVEFHSGQVHRFEGVAEKHHTAMLKAKSVGSYFHSHIRKHNSTQL